MKKPIKLPDTASEKRIVVLQANGMYRIVGLAPVSTLRLCNEASFLNNSIVPFTKEGAALVAMKPRYALYKEHVSVEGLKTFNGMQR